MSRYQTRRAGSLPDWLDWFDPRKSQAILDEAYSKSKSRKKAKQTPGSINPDNPKQYWSGSKWLNLSDIPPNAISSIPQTSEDNKQKAEETAVASNEKGLLGNYGGINANLNVVYDKKGTVQDKGVSTAKAAASENILTRWADKQSPSKGSVGKNLRTIEELRGSKPPETSAQEQVNTFNAGVHSPFNSRDSFISQRSPFNPANQANMIDPAKSFSGPSLNIPEVQQYQKLADLPTNAFTNANMNTAAAEGAGFMGFKDAGTAASKLGAFSKGLELLNKMTAKEPEPNINVSLSLIHI